MAGRIPIALRDQGVEREAHHHFPNGVHLPRRGPRVNPDPGHAHFRRQEGRQGHQAPGRVRGNVVGTGSIFSVEAAALVLVVGSDRPSPSTLGIARQAYLPQPLPTVSEHPVTFSRNRNGRDIAVAVA